MVSGSPIDVKYVFPEAIANFTLRNNVDRNFNKYLDLRSIVALKRYIFLSLSLFLSANEQTFKSHSNFSFVSSKVFLNDAGSLHRCHGQISHHHPLVKLPHHYERVPGKFQHVTLVIKYFLHHSTDIRVQCLRQFRWPAFPNFRIFLGEVCETLTKKFFFLSIFFYGFLILFFIFLYEIVIFYITRHIAKHQSRVIHSSFIIVVIIQNFIRTHRGKYFRVIFDSHLRDL